MAAEGSGSFYTLGDASLQARATGGPRRGGARPGAADIGGRMRVAAILRRAGIERPEMPERIAGSTNEVWRAGPYIVRVGTVPGAVRLQREARLAKHLPFAVQYPKVVASGVEEFGEWIVVRHRAGVPLSQAWASMAHEERRDVVHQLAEAMRAVHQVPVDEALLAELDFDDGDTRGDSLEAPHQLPADRVLELLDRASALAHVDRGLLRLARERTEQLRSSIDGEAATGLVHGDLHLENVLVVDGVLVGLLDFEWCRPGPPEVDLDVLARFCADPALHIGGDYPVHRRDFADVLHWVAEAYPEVFAHPRVVDRLVLCALAFEVPWLLRMPPDRPLASLPEFHPARQLQALLEHGSHAERIGWDGGSVFDLIKRH